MKNNHFKTLSLNLIIIFVLVIIGLWYCELRIKQVEKKINDVHNGLIDMHGENYSKHVEGYEK